MPDAADDGYYDDRYVGDVHAAREGSSFREQRGFGRPPRMPGQPRRLEPWDNRPYKQPSGELPPEMPPPGRWDGAAQGGGWWTRGRDVGVVWERVGEVWGV